MIPMIAEDKTDTPEMMKREYSSTFANCNRASPSIPLSTCAVMYAADVYDDDVTNQSAVNTVKIAGQK
tara:strand:+ start:125 stop:328 length:204 start_codon:yes stop_codon:yes gene_type:complete